MSLPLWPGSPIAATSEVEFQGPLVTAFDRALFGLVKIALIVALVPLQFWSTGWLVGQVGLRYEISGFWSTLGGAVIFNLVFVILASLLAVRVKVIPPSST